MKEQNNIPTSKVERATKFVQTGAKIGGNYIKHYAKKAFNPELTKEQLHEDNSKDVYETLSQLKGSALKVAQMLSQDKNMLPQAYVDKFTMAQYSAPPLSYPLVVKTFQKYFGKSPESMFDTFERNASNAASIGQVHKATKDGKVFAVKIQYPGVAESVSSDLKLVKPFALRLMNMKEKDLDMYMDEVESKLIEETDYELELRRSNEISTQCAHITGLVFPAYYPEYSSKRILTMDWLEGLHMKEFLATNPSQEIRNQIGQLLWDFYDFQMHQLRTVHADPHPGNFLMRSNGSLGVIDFGCVKEIPEEFYNEYFKLLNKEVIQDKTELLKTFERLNFFDAEDTALQREIFFDLFCEMTHLLGLPFYSETFDFSDDSYFKRIYDFGEHISNVKEIKDARQARGSRHGIYINRTYFGLYNLLNQLGANVRTKSYGEVAIEV
jgi:predicted unusual protein kinase regulating ubiquinone biosynthesis (AarF/ABC1/UbiB family)